MEVDKSLKMSISNQFKFFLIQISSTLITGVFLALWVGIQFGLNKLIQWLQPSGLDQLVLVIFQFIFGVTTLLPVIFYYYEDLSIAWIRVRKRISEEKETSKIDS